jgi:Coenzyme PQQ synthesis protein D (PqqD)
MKETYSVVHDVLFTQLDDGTGVLLHLGSGQYFTLNRPGVVVWKALTEGVNDVIGLTHRLCATFEVDLEVAETEASRLVGELRKDGLIRADRV